MPRDAPRRRLRRADAARRHRARAHVPRRLARPARPRSPSPTSRTGSVFHDGRWSADVTIRNESDKPLYETVWRRTRHGFRWDGPALVYSGPRRARQPPADLRPGRRRAARVALPAAHRAEWRGTSRGKVPSKPAAAAHTDIWLRLPGLRDRPAMGHVDNAALAVQVISERGAAVRAWRHLARFATGCSSPVRSRPSCSCSRSCSDRRSSPSPRPRKRHTAPVRDRPDHAQARRPVHQRVEHHARVHRRHRLRAQGAATRDGQDVPDSRAPTARSVATSCCGCSREAACRSRSRSAAL